MTRASAVALLVLSGCTPAVDDPAQWVLADGRAVGTLSGARSAYVVLVMDPTDVFTCAGTLAEWLEWRRNAPYAFHLVFTRAPAGPERRRLKALRLPVDGTLAARTSAATPVELLVAGGRIVHADRGVRQVDRSRLLRLVRTRALESVVLHLEHDGRHPPSPGDSP